MSRGVGHDLERLVGIFWWLRYCATEANGVLNPCLVKVLSVIHSTLATATVTRSTANHAVIPY